jgi:hypothetical protein
MSNALFYREQAQREEALIEAAILDNVRDRHRRAAAAWNVLADRLARNDALRAEKNAATTSAESSSHDD